MSGHVRAIVGFLCALTHFGVPRPESTRGFLTEKNVSSGSSAQRVEVRAAQVSALSVFESACVAFLRPESIDVRDSKFFTVSVEYA